MNVQRIEETINGKPYSIEIARVAANKWRAHLVKLHGGPTALMPFYGATPDEAARQLTDWLTRAHRSAASNSHQ